MYVDRKEKWFWNLSNERVWGEIWSPGKINQSPGKVLEIFFWKRVQALFIAWPVEVFGSDCYWKSWYTKSWHDSQVLCACHALIRVLHWHGLGLLKSCKLMQTLKVIYIAWFLFPFPENSREQLWKRLTKTQRDQIISPVAKMFL